MNDASEATDEDTEVVVELPVVKSAGTKKYRQVSASCQLIEDLSYSPREFYGLILNQLDSRQIPDLGLGTFTLPEGTIFSHDRLYLQIRRERLLFEICGAPFGTGFFVSNRLIDRRLEADWRDYLANLTLIGLLGYLAWQQLGTVNALIVVGLILTFFWSLMRMAASRTAEWLDSTIWSMPFLGPIYESWFHPDTYYRQDQMAMYQVAVENSVKSAIADMTRQGGVAGQRGGQEPPLHPQFQRPE